jgi:divinyl chlorophyllide a 8-vinyl-reductase
MFFLSLNQLLSVAFLLAIEGPQLFSTAFTLKHGGLCNLRGFTSSPIAQNSHSRIYASTTEPKSKNVVIFGATGYIGKYVVKESVRRGYNTIAVVRSGSKVDDKFLNGANIVTSDVTDENALKAELGKTKSDVVISCLASRSGTQSDSFLIDYQATLNALNAARSNGARFKILISILFSKIFMATQF